jgi:hypothetical protein
MRARISSAYVTQYISIISIIKKERKVHGLNENLNSIHTYFFEHLSDFFILSYLKVYILQKSSAKGAAVISALEKLVHYMAIFRLSA